MPNVGLGQEAVRDVSHPYVQRLAGYDLTRRFEHYATNYGPYLPSDRQAAILDVGCGDGPFLEYLWRNGYTNLKGVDVDGSCVEASRQRLSVPVERIESIEAYVREERERFDLITLIGVAMYLPQDEIVSALRQCGQLLTPRGRLVVEVLNGSALTGSVFQFKSWELRTTFTEHSLRRALEEAGYHVEALFGERIAVKSPKRLLWLAARRMWFACLAGVYLLEWGREPERPRIFSKSLIAVARPTS